LFRGHRSYPAPTDYRGYSISGALQARKRSSRFLDCKIQSGQHKFRAYFVDISLRERIIAPASPLLRPGSRSLRRCNSLQEKIMSLRRLVPGTPFGMAYPGHRHFAKRLLSRRGFLEKSGITLGAIAASGLVPELARAALKTHGHNSTTSAIPLPIPGGMELLGPSGPLFHIFYPLPASSRRLSPTSMVSWAGPRWAAWVRTR
jgi:hypothetical protein